MKNAISICRNALGTQKQRCQMSTVVCVVVMFSCASTGLWLQSSALAWGFALMGVFHLVQCELCRAKSDQKLDTSIIAMLNANGLVEYDELRATVGSSRRSSAANVYFFFSIDRLQREGYLYRQIDERGVLMSLTTSGRAQAFCDALTNHHAPTK